MNQRERRIYLINALMEELPEYKAIRIPDDDRGQQRLLRTLFNVRPPFPASAEFLEIQDAYLSERIRERGITDVSQLKASKTNDRVYLWQGDITTLMCDAIVNAANSALLGCFQPCHSCIDNIVHSLSGVQLRIKCNEIMEAQGHDETTGQLKLHRDTISPVNMYCILSAQLYLGNCKTKIVSCWQTAIALVWSWPLQMRFSPLPSAAFQREYSIFRRIRQRKLP